MDGLDFGWLMHAVAEPWPAPPEQEPKGSQDNACPPQLLYAQGANRASRADRWSALAARRGVDHGRGLLGLTRSGPRSHGQVGACRGLRYPAVRELHVALPPEPDEELHQFY
jgi:hypothetical protein